MNTDSPVFAGFVMGILFLVVVAMSAGTALFYEYKVKKLEERVDTHLTWLYELDQKMEKYQKFLGAV